MKEVLIVGSFVQDLAFRTEIFPAPGETRVGEFFSGPGGKGFNQAVACHRQGVPTRFIGAVGVDIFSQGLRHFAEQEKIRTSLLEVPNVSTGAASIVVDGSGQNQIIVSLGANDFLTPRFVRDNFGSPGVVLVQAESNIDAAKEALTLARQTGATTILNPAPINKFISRELLGLSDIMTPNETEFMFLFEHILGRKLNTDFYKINSIDLNSLCRELGVQTVVLTLGENGAFISTPTGFVKVPPIEVDLVDTTGAGDAFSGGLAAGLVKFSGDLFSAATFATVVAGLSTQRAGTAPAMPTAEEVNQRFKLEHVTVARS